MAGAMVLRHAGGNHIARVRVAMGDGGFTALQADGGGDPHSARRDSAADSGVYHRRPGPIAAARAAAAGARRAASDSRRRRRRADGVVDLEPEQWHQVPDPALPDRRDDARRRSQLARDPCSSLGPCVSQPPRSANRYASGGKEFSCRTTNGGPAPAPQPQPQLNVVAQYIKDFSFENPNAPQSLTRRQPAAADRHSDQCRRQAAVGHRRRGDAQARGQGGERRQR